MGLSEVDIPEEAFATISLLPPFPAVKLILAVVEVIKLDVKLVACVGGLHTVKFTVEPL